MFAAAAAKHLIEWWKQKPVCIVFRWPSDVDPRMHCILVRILCGCSIVDLVLQKCQGTGGIILVSCSSTLLVSSDTGRYRGQMCLAAPLIILWLT